MKLIFEGRKDRIETLAKLNKTYAKRNNVSISVYQGGDQGELLEGPAFNVADTITLINEAENVESLKDFETDTRKTVIKALEARKIKLLEQ